MERFYGIDSLLTYFSEQGIDEFTEQDIHDLIKQRLIPHYVSFGKRYSFHKDYIDSWVKSYAHKKNSVTR